MSAYQKPKAKDLSYIFSGLVDSYSEIGLKACEMKELQIWRNANIQKIAKRLA